MALKVKKIDGFGLNYMEYEVKEVSTLREAIITARKFMDEILLKASTKKDLSEEDKQLLADERSRREIIDELVQYAFAFHFHSSNEAFIEFELNRSTKIKLGGRVRIVEE